MLRAVRFHSKAELTAEIMQCIVCPYRLGQVTIKDRYKIDEGSIKDRRIGIRAFLKSESDSYVWIKCA
jgi:hypothetical protein